MTTSHLHVSWTFSDNNFINCCFVEALFFRKWSSSYRYWCTPIGFLNYNFTTSQFRDWKDAVKKACSHTLFRKLKAEGGSFPFLTCVGFATTVRSS